MQREEKDGVPHDPVTVTWFSYFKVQLTTGKEQTQHAYLLFKYLMFYKALCCIFYGYSKIKVISKMQ